MCVSTSVLWVSVKKAQSALQPSYGVVRCTGALGSSLGLGPSSDLSKPCNFCGFVVGTSK